mgnify:CR=1 FL=1
MLEKAFRKERLNFNTLVKSEKMMQIVEQFGFKAVDDLVANVGYGKITPLQVLRKFAPKVDEEEVDESIFNKLIGRVRKKKPKTGILVNGVDDILIKFGKCCQPVPGDPILGYIFDNWRGKWFRGKPFLLLGVLLIHETREFVSWYWDTSELNLIVIGLLLINSVLLNAWLTPKGRE